MLKINLLPSYIFEKRKVRRTAMMFGVLLLGVAVGMFAWYSVLAAKQRDLTVQVADMEAKANEVKALDAQAAAEEAKAPPLQNKVSFIENVMNYNLEYPKLYEDLAKYTYSRIVYRSVEPSGTQLKIGASARSVGDCGRYLLNMYRATHVFSGVTIDAVPGWSGSIPRGFDFNVTCNLVKPIAAPTYAGAVGPGQPGAPPM
ncbi:MAG: hypothetical protein NTU88_15330 [Armatimonadetes bacterium]|nr:hypothetical protein [Armatimonadota bacterium]